MTEGKRQIIQQLLQEYDIESAEDIQDALKGLLGGTIKEMMSVVRGTVLLTTLRSFVTVSPRRLIMPRTARIQSAIGCYHVVLRGIGKQILFEEEEDYQRFKLTLERYIQEEKADVYAYCLMENHVHILLHIDSGLDRLMKRIGVSYSYYFNEKYTRSGHLFQDRFSNEEVECLDISDRRRIPDKDALEIIRNELHLQSGTDLQNMNREARDKALRQLKEKGLSVRQIERLTGINRGVVLNA